MASFRYAFVALRVITDRDTNSNSYIDVIDGFTVPMLPATLQPLSIVSVWEQEATPGQLVMRVDFIGPDEKAILPPFQVPLQQISARSHHRVNVNLAGLPLQQPGRYYFRIEEQRAGEWVEVGRVPLDVQYKPLNPSVVIQQPDGTRAPLKH